LESLQHALFKKRQAAPERRVSLPDLFSASDAAFCIAFRVLGLIATPRLSARSSFE
jgi:hypothetical protein